MPPVADRDGKKKSFLLKCDLQFVSHQEMALIKKGDETVGQLWSICNESQTEAYDLAC